jgi:predicted amidohydrolase/GNAT superfamily N-acetyltransferase
MNQQPLEESAHKLTLRNLALDDYADIKEIMDALYPTMGGAWPLNKYRAQLTVFGQGQICIEDHGKVVAAAFSLVVEYARFGDQHTYDQITGNAFLTTHDPLGDVLYGMEVVVAKEYQGLRLGRRLYEARKELCRSLNLRAIVAGGRIPGYEKYASEMSPQEYIKRVKKKEFYDPILTFQLSNDFEVKRVLKNYLPEDRASRGYATLLEWSNLYYENRQTPLFGAVKTSARIGCVQWQMRPVKSVDELLKQVEFFIDALSDYQCDLALLPEFFNAALMGIESHSTSIDSIRALASFSKVVVDRISHLAVSYNINIIAGSMPVLVDNELFNVAYFCRRDGTVESQEKIHPTPQEKRAWIMRGGSKLNVFETEFGKIGILICYDVEFPELARLLSEAGVQLLFVPFWTDTKNAYLRVRCCAQARAIENECYVVISGSVGNLPKVDGADIQYAQSAVFSPSDFSFPHDAIMAETTPNTEMTLIVDLDMERLNKLRNEGSVNNFFDRRRDLYRISWLVNEQTD